VLLLVLVDTRRGVYYRQLAICIQRHNGATVFSRLPLPALSARTSAGGCDAGVTGEVGVGFTPKPLVQGFRIHAFSASSPQPQLMLGVQSPMIPERPARIRSEGCPLVDDGGGGDESLIAKKMCPFADGGGVCSDGKGLGRVTSSEHSAVPSAPSPDRCGYMYVYIFQRKGPCDRLAIGRRKGPPEHADRAGDGSGTLAGRSRRFTHRTQI